MSPPATRRRRRGSGIDLHLHTTASDGQATPEQLIAVASAAGVRVLAVTDHDTTASVARVGTLAASSGIEAISGIEITAVDSGADVHVLGYFVSPEAPMLAAFLQQQRAGRVARVRAIGRRLETLGMPLDLSKLLEEVVAQPGRAVGRPQVARALVEAGYVGDVREAFERWLGRGLPAFVSREGASSEQVIDIIHRAGGVASLAHPGRSTTFERLAQLRAAGLDAVEVYHPDHDRDLTHHYRDVARRLGMLETGGSDYHGDPAHGAAPGRVTLPDMAWDRLRAAAACHVVD